MNLDIYYNYYCYTNTEDISVIFDRELRKVKAKLSRPGKVTFSIDNDMEKVYPKIKFYITSFGYDVKEKVINGENICYVE